MSAYTPEDRTDHPDVAANPIEANVPNSAKVLPSSRGTVLLLSILSGVAAICAVVATKAMGLEMLALVLAVVAVAAGVIAVIMARGDARASAITPGIVTVFAAIIAVVVTLDVIDVDDAVEQGPAGSSPAPQAQQNNAAP